MKCQLKELEELRISVLDGKHDSCGQYLYKFYSLKKT